MKNILIILVFFIVQFSSWSQKTIKTLTPCNDAILMDIKGKWIKGAEVSPGRMGLTQLQTQEVSKWFDEVNKMVLEVYPTPVGAIAAWSCGAFQAEFAKHVRFVKTSDGRVEEETVSGKPYPAFEYNCIISKYYCAGPNEIRNIYPEISGGTGMEITANGGLSNFLGDCGVQADEATIEGHPIKMKKTAAKIWKGYEICYPSGAGGPESDEKSGNWCMLIHRKGMLPYIPVTKKQYLEQALKYFPKFFDYNPKILDLIPDKQQRDEAINRNTKLKNAVMKFYHDELDKATNGSLDSPAIIQGPCFNPTDNFPFFTTEAAGGSMLVTENPKYMRKDLPLYVPQFFLVSWGWSNSPAFMKFGKAINENFPIERLQEMIDK